MGLNVLYGIPIWVNWIIVLAMLWLSVEVGYRLGLARRKSWPDGEIGGGAVVLSTMLALLGLILAFTYSASTDRHEARKQAVIVEANALGTAYLRAQMIDEPASSELRAALQRYARTRVIEGHNLADFYSDDGLQKIIANSTEAQSELWPMTKAIIQQQGRDPITAGLMASINEVIDLHTVRVAAVRDRLPTIVVAMLLFIACAAMAVTGFHAGLSGVISRWRLSLFAMVLTSIMMVIVDLDRPRDGFVKVGQDSLEDLLADMERAQGAQARSFGKP